MKIQFEKNQQYQIDAINAVINALEGQDLATTDFEFSLADSQKGSLEFTTNGIGNRLTISPEQLLTNIQHVQQQNELEPSKQLDFIEYRDETGQYVESNFANLSIEMETGTGKTYVYLRSIYELNKTYGFKKFVIVVPSVAIREGVLKNLQITFDHFQELYNSTPASFEVYDSKKPASLTNFSRSNTIQILVINIDSFTKDVNIINQIRERGIKPIEYIQGTRPIVIIDEPQNMDTDIRKKAISNLNPLFTLRYSATHSNTYNLLYKLDPVKAYDLGLVKQIEVDSVLSANDNAGAYMSLDGFKIAKKSLSATMTILVNTGKGITKKSVTVKTGDDLYLVSGRVDTYKDGYTINEIDAEAEKVEFSGGTTLFQGQPIGGMNTEIQKEMIKATIENHLRKELELNPKGIKVLSVFFLDKVANYREYTADGKAQSGIFAKWFEELLKELLKNPKYSSLYPYPVEQMHDGYFSQDKGKLKDSKEGKPSKADDEAYQLIMKDKERLLDMNTPLRFIFSHSALREGWDNPNVFQICTLNETKSEIKKRQEIGRGLRLCVTQTGQRNMDRSVNKLTVISNESYEVFAKKLQTEIQQDCGVAFDGNRIKDARKRQPIKLKKGWDLDQNFLDLWERIKHKTEYKVDYSTQELIERASERVREMPSIPKPQIQRIRTEAVFERDEENKLIQIGGDVKASKERTVDNIRFEIPDFVGYIQSKTELTRHTVTNILMKSGRIGEIFNNPQIFMDSVVKSIHMEFDKLKVNGIKYEKIAGQSYQMTLFENEELEAYLDGNLIPVMNQDRTLYDHIQIDSLSAPEREFAQACESRDDVLFYLKLPSWFKIKTPIGNYNPDWALIKQEEGEQKKLYFVAETKGTSSLQELEQSKPLEAMKVKCGMKHFAQFEDVRFRQVRNFIDL